MNRPPAWRTVAALAVLVPAWGLACASIALAWIFQLPAAPVAGMFLSPAPPQAQARFDDIGVAVAFVYAPLAAVLLLRRPQPVAVLLGAHAVGSGLAAFGVQYVPFGVLVDSKNRALWQGNSLQLTPEIIEKSSK